MRIAVSGTHCCGKSTLVDEFLANHPDFTHEPEAYEALDQDFPAEPSADDFVRQLEYNIDRINSSRPGHHVIFERSPADYLAYILALGDLGRDPLTQLLVENFTDVSRSALQRLDVIVFLRPNSVYDLPEDEDLVLRTRVDKRLEAILVDNQLDLISDDRPVVLEVTGSTAQRLQALEDLISRCSSKFLL